MINAKLRKIKIAIVVILAVCVFVLVLGVQRFQGDYYWQKNYVAMQWLFASTKTEYLVENSAIFAKLSGNNSANQFRAMDAGKGTQSVPVLLYHGVISDPNWTPDDVNTRLADFKAQMILLKKMGYETVTMEDFVEFMKGEKNLPPKSFLLTFDDGRKDSYYPVDPILKALNYHAVMFVITGRSLEGAASSNTFHLNETEVKKMVQSGRWDIESHTQNGHDMEKIDFEGDQGHFMTNRIWLESEKRLETKEEYAQRIEKDLNGSREDIEKKLGTRADAFAFPFGDFGIGTANFPDSADILLPIVEKIFPNSFYQVRNTDYIGNYPGQTSLFKRISVSSQIPADKLVSILLNSQDKNAANYDDNFVSDKGWSEGWGRRQFENGLMLTGATDSEDSSLTFLEGSYLWSNYNFQSTVKLVKGRAFALLARYRDSTNYVSCDFSENEVSVSQHINDVETTLASAAFSSQIFSDQADAGISAQGQNIACMVNGDVISSANVDPTLSWGGIGFKTWDNRLFNSELLVKHVLVEGTSMASKQTFRESLISER